jgi:hypothetical protein
VRARQPDFIDGRRWERHRPRRHGADSIRGGGGQDQQFGENGADSIDGRDGTPGDVVAGGNGQDSVVGDPGDSVTQ